MVCFANNGLNTDLSTQPSEVVWNTLISLVNLAVSDNTQYMYTFTSPSPPEDLPGDPQDLPTPVKPWLAPGHPWRHMIQAGQAVPNIVQI